MQRARCPWALALASAGRRRLARMAIMAMTTSNSMRVNAERARGAMFMGNPAQARFPAAEKRALFLGRFGMFRPSAHLCGQRRKLRKRGESDLAHRGRQQVFLPPCLELWRDRKIPSDG